MAISLVPHSQAQLENEEWTILYVFEYDVDFHKEGNVLGFIHGPQFLWRP